MTTPTLGGSLLGRADPHRSRGGCRAAFGCEPNEGGFIRCGGVAVLIDGRVDVAAANPEPGRAILTIHVDDAPVSAAHLDRIGATRLVPVEAREDGLFGTLIDPDGNDVRINERNEPFRASRRARTGARSPQASPSSGIAVDDVPAAKRFYAETLGMDVAAQHGMPRLHRLAGSNVLVYPLPDHTPASFTVLGAPVADVGPAVEDSAGRGVAFERDEGTEADEKGVHRNEGPPIARCKDPTGNVLSVR